MNTLENNNNPYLRITIIGGVLYLILIACGVYAEIFVLSELVVGNDPTATANNILSRETLYRTGVFAHIVTLLCSSLLLGILFKIFKSTSEYLVLTLLVFNIVTVAIEGVSILYELETLSILKSKMLASLFSPDQINALAYLPLKMQSTTYDLALLFFGVACCLISILILKSELFFRWVGLLMFAAGVCYITNSVAYFISPTFRNYLLPYILIPCFIAELSLSINMIAGSRRTRQSL
ncbi:MAG: DUF4386 domain-containing protein [Cytophagales bacterium]|nr:DUF4386 domain-containing protein [Cytophagales bacterium]